MGRLVPPSGGVESQQRLEISWREDARTASQNVGWLHDEILRIEDHWTSQIQNQQRRIAAVIAVNGFLLAFLAAAGLGANANFLSHHWFAFPFYLSLVFLSIALVFGMLLLLPRIGIGSGNNKVAKDEVDAPVGLEPPPVSEAEVDARTHAAERDKHQRRSFVGKIWNWFYSNFGPLPEKRPDYWLDSERVFRRFVASLDISMLDASDAVVLDVTESSARNANWNLDLFKAEQARRRWIHWESAFILLGILSLIVTVAGLTHDAFPWFG